MTPVPAVALSVRSHTDSRYLEIEWDDGVVSHYPHGYLRRRCRCAECVRASRTGTTIEPPADISLLAMIPFGPVSLQLKFSDGHEHGIYPFAYLRDVAAESGLSSEPNLS